MRWNVASAFLNVRVAVRRVDTGAIYQDIQPAAEFQRAPTMALTFVYLRNISGADSDRVRGSEAATSSRPARLTSLMTTLAPSETKRLAVAAPMPLPAPVIRAVFPCSVIVLVPFQPV
jgi:hypothetical protein